MRILTSTLGTAAALAVLLVSPAHGFDLTGHWVGKWSCKGFDGGKFTSSQPNKEDKNASTLAITQVQGGTFAASIDNGSFTYNAVAIPDSSKPEKGEVTLLGCHLANTLPPPSFDGELVRASVQTKAGTFKASFKATSIFVDDFPEDGTCKYSYKRIDTIDPGLSACPP